MMIVIFLLYDNRVQLSILPIPKSLAGLKFGKLAKNSVWWHKVSKFYLKYQEILGLSLVK